MAVLTYFTAALKGQEPQQFPNPYDAMASLIDTQGEADVCIVDTNGKREPLLHRDIHGSWESA